MKKWFALIVLSVALSALSVGAGAQDTDKGSLLYAQCISCHGEKGEGKPSQKAPKISGQFDWYIVKQLSEAKSGVRKSVTMSSYASKLSEQDMKDLAAYISKL